MTEDSKPRVDLLGDAWAPLPDPRGRKRHKRNREIAEKVGVLVASEHSVAEISQNLGLSEYILNQYYFRELQSGAVLAQAELEARIYKRAMDGSAAHARLWLDMQQRRLEAQPGRRRSAPVAPAKLGKKEQAQLDAKTAADGTTWSSLVN